MSVLARYFSNRLRRPTRSSSPLRLWWSCLCTLRCSVRSLIRRVNSATWTSGEPVSPSLVACWPMISFFTAMSSGTRLLHLNRGQAALLPQPGAVGSLLIRGGRHPLHEGAARRGQLPTGRNSRYHGHNTACPLLGVPRRGVVCVLGPLVNANYGIGQILGPGRHPPGLGHILVHLGDEFVHRRELDRRAQEGGEVDGHVRAVQVEIVTVERVRFHGPHALVEHGRLER